jgi:hypothetical protein
MDDPALRGDWISTKLLPRCHCVVEDAAREAYVVFMERLVLSDWDHSVASDGTTRSVVPDGSVMRDYRCVQVYRFGGAAQPQRIGLACRGTYAGDSEVVPRPVGFLILRIIAGQVLRGSGCGF